MSHTLQNLHIQNFRGFKDLHLKDLCKINLFVGINNSGKTSVLESIALLCNPLDPFNWIATATRQPSASRHFKTPELEDLKWLAFHKHEETNSSSNQKQEKLSFSITTESKIFFLNFNAIIEDIYGTETIQSEDIESDLGQAKISNGVEIIIISKSTIIPKSEGSRIGQLTFTELPDEQRNIFRFWENERFTYRSKTKNFSFIETAIVLPSYSSSEVGLIMRLSSSILEKKESDFKEKILEIIQLFDPDILDLIILAPTGKPNLYIVHKKLEYAPLHIFGDGIKKVLMIAVQIAALDNGILLIDEIETSIHISILGKIFQWIVQSCLEKNIQLFITTHSLEAIDAIIEAIDKIDDFDIDDLVAFKLKLPDKPPQRFHGDLLQRLRFERGLDVR